MNAYGFLAAIYKNRRNEKDTVSRSC